MVIQGAGGLGIQAAAVAKDMGAATVIVVDQIAGRLELARAFGADHTINIKEVPERRTAWRWCASGRAASAPMSPATSSAFPQVIPEGIEMLRAGGTYLEIGTISRGRQDRARAGARWCGARRRSSASSMYDPRVIPRALDFLVRNRARWPFDQLVSHKYPLEQINEAFADSEWHGRDTTTITRAALAP